MINKTVQQVTDTIILRSDKTRNDYLDDMRELSQTGVIRQSLACGNLAHGMAACSQGQKDIIRQMDAANIGIITAYNDMLSAHQPFESYPQIIKEAVQSQGCTAQVAGGVPAMCDGVTQGQDGMELSLFSRDVIAQASAVALSHNMFDAALCLGVCDKIVPGLLMGALRFGYLPFIFVPAGPMTSGITNDEKARVRKLFSEGKVSRDELLASESASYHGPGTCTFYGTANSNQMLMEIMGLHLPGSSFVNPHLELRKKLTESAAIRATRITRLKEEYTPLSTVIDEKAIVNGIIGLLATGGSTNHTLHLIAIAKSAGIHINWSDFQQLSKVTPLLARVYPNGKADINHFHAAGGMAYLMGELLDNGFLHNDVNTVAGRGLEHYVKDAKLGADGEVTWVNGSKQSHNTTILRPVSDPFEGQGGLQLLKGNLGRSVIKTSAVARIHRVVDAPALVFNSQEDFVKACKQGKITSDRVVVVRFQGPKANGMPELHQLTPYMAVLQDKGINVALVTDGRMSGASGKVPAAIHLCPEAADDGLIAKIQDGDRIRLDAESGVLELMVDPGELASRKACQMSDDKVVGLGREFFSGARRAVSNAEQGASFLFDEN